MCLGIPAMGHPIDSHRSSLPQAAPQAVAAEEAAAALKAEETQAIKATGARNGYGES